MVNACVCHKVRCAARAVTRIYDAALRPTGLRATQLLVLVAISAEGALSITALADYMGMDRSTLTRNLRPLVKEGLVSLGLEGWRRSREVFVTQKGTQRMRQAVPYWARAQQSLRDKVEPASWLAASRTLDELARMT